MQCRNAYAMLVPHVKPCQAECCQEMGYSVCKQQFGEQTSVVASLQAATTARSCSHAVLVARVAMPARAP